MTQSLALSPLGSILADVRRAIEVQLYYPAILVCLTIPEICVALTLDRSVFVKQKHYVDFVNKYTTPRELGLDGMDCYRLRGGVVHRANMAGHGMFAATNVIFTLPSHPIGMHAFSINAGEKQAFMLDMTCFSSAMIGAAERWFAEYSSDPRVTANMDDLIRLCPVGVPPFVEGTPVVASGP